MMGVVFRAFKLLATEGRVCALGLVLLGVLGRVGRCLKVGGRMEDEDGAGEVFGDDGIGVRDEVRKGGKVMDLGGEDLGERVERDVLLDKDPLDETEEEGGVEMLVALGEVDVGMMGRQEHGVKTKQKMEKPKRRKKKGNVIDDLFSGLS